jgi:hypothetical protein
MDGTAYISQNIERPILKHSKIFSSILSISTQRYKRQLLNREKNGKAKQTIDLLSLLTSHNHAE